MSRHRVIGVSQQEAELLAEFRRNTPEARSMIVGLTKTSADMFQEEMSQAIADIDSQALIAGGVK